MTGPPHDLAAARQDQLLSLLFEEAPAARGAEGQDEDRSFASDLNLDQIVAAIAGDREERDLITTVLYGHLRDVDAVRYRQEVFQDLENPALFDQVERFADLMHQVRSGEHPVAGVRGGPCHSRGQAIPAGLVAAEPARPARFAPGPCPARGRSLVTIHGFASSVPYDVLGNFDLRHPGMMPRSCAGPRSGTAQAAGCGILVR